MKTEPYTRIGDRTTRTDREALLAIKNQIATYGGEDAEQNYALLVRINKIVFKQVKES